MAMLKESWWLKPGQERTVARYGYASYGPIGENGIVTIGPEIGTQMEVASYAIDRNTLGWGDTVTWVPDPQYPLRARITGIVRRWRDDHRYDVGGDMNVA